MSGDQSIKRRLFLIFAVMGALLALVGVTSFIGFSETGIAVSGIVSRDVPAAMAATRLKSQIAELSAMLPSLLAARRPMDLEVITAKITDTAKQIDTTLADLKQTADSSETDELAVHLSIIQKDLNDLNESATQRIAGTDLINKITGETRQYQHDIDALLTPMIDDADFNLELAITAATDVKRAAAKNKVKVDARQVETSTGGTFKDALDTLKTLLKLNAETNWIAGTFSAIATTPNPDDIDNARINFDQIIHKVERHLNEIGPDSDAGKLGDITAHMLDLGQGPNGIFTGRRSFLMREHDEQQLIDRINEENVALALLIKKIADNASGNSTASMRDLAKRISVSQTIIVCGILVSLILGFLATVFMNKRIAIPIQQMGELMRRMRSHDIAMNAMLDSLGQGLLFFGADGICSPTYSKACEALLECIPAHQHIADIIKLPEAKRALFKTIVDMLFKGRMALGFEELSALAPASYEHSKGLAISLAYRPIMGADGLLSSVLAVATDRTQEKKAEALQKENEQAAERVIRILRNRNYFFRFVQSFQNYFDLLNPDMIAGSVEQIRRDIHTFKGAADTFHLSELAQALHRLESDLSDGTADPGSAITMRRPELTDTFQASIAAASAILGDDFLTSGKVRTIPEQRLMDFARRLRCDTGDQALSEHYFEELMAVPLWECLNEFAVALQELADRFGKPVNPCVFTGTNFPVLQPVYEALFASFVHIARNIIDHGIETADIRKESGKPAYATVSVRTEPFQRDGQDWFAIEFNDDGSGIDLAALKVKMIEKGLPELANADDQVILDHIFDGGMSTKKQTTMLSGRGIGLNAVKAETIKLGGTVAIATRQGKGATLHVEVPLVRTLA